MESTINEKKVKLCEILEELVNKFDDLSKESYFIKISLKMKDEVIRNGDFLYLNPNYSGEWDKLTSKEKKNKLKKIETDLDRAQKQLDVLFDFLGTKQK